MNRANARSSRATLVTLETRKRAFRERAREAGYRVEAGDETVPSLAERRVHVPYRLVRTRERGDSRSLYEGGDAAERVVLKSVTTLASSWRDRVAEAPTGHGVRLGEAVDDHGALAHAGSDAIETNSLSR